MNKSGVGELQKNLEIESVMNVLSSARERVVLVRGTVARVVDRISGEMPGTAIVEQPPIPSPNGVYSAMRDDINLIIQAINAIEIDVERL